jgi:maltooligosyltrehalose trehalohydrolase
MHRFEVWAPRAAKLAVEVNAIALPMQGPDKQGWWHLDVNDAEPGTDYGFVIGDEARSYPDPRSLWQPNGVHAHSRIYDHAAFAWSDSQFQAPPLSGAIVYELHLGTFTQEGTLDAAIGRLDHLADIGVTHVELMPVAAFAGEHGWGYDAVALYAVHQPYGGPDALKRFVDAAHAKGLAVLLDVVYNHFGPVGNYTGKYGAYITESHHTPWGGAVNLEDAGSHQVRRFFCDNALMWLRDFHVDGLRLDAVHAFVDRSAIHFLEQLSAEVETLGATLARRLFLIAESDLNDPRIVTAREAGGFGIHAQWSDDFHHALFTVLSPGPPLGYFADFGLMSQLAKALERTFVYDGEYSTYRDRIHGRTVGNLSQHRFLGFIQNHDQVGNRAEGDRIAQVAGMDRAKIAAALVLMSPFIPMLFQGEEWAASSPFLYFADHEDPEMARLVSEGRKREFAPFGWDPASIPDPEKRETFERSKLHWDEMNTGDHAEMLRWYRALIALRRSTPCLNDGEPGHTHVEGDEEQKWLSMRRGRILVVCHLGAEERAFNVPAGSEIVLASREEVRMHNEGLSLPPDTVAIIRAPQTPDSF